MFPPPPAEPSSSPLPFRRALLLVVVFAAAVRLFGLNFDQGHFYHPDERAIADATLRITFRPLQLNPHFFPYGSFPFYVTKLTTVPLAVFKPWFASYDGILYTGRFLSALWGAATVALLVLVGRRWYGEKAGLLAGLLLSASVLHLQYSHFAANDVPLAFLVLLALALLGRFAEGGRTRDLAAAALVTGFAIATKVSAAPLLLPMAVALWFRVRADKSFVRVAKLGLAAAVLAVIGFAVGEPYAFLDHTEFLRSVSEQGHMVRYAGDVPYTNQYIGTPKGLYELKELVLWGMGPFLGLAALWGTLRKAGRMRSLVPAEAIALSWVVPFFLVSASFDVRFPRYLLPIYPLLALWAAAWLVSLVGRRGRLVRAVVLGGTGLYALAFLTIYTRPHSIVTASEWFYEHIPDGKRVLIQDWDEGFPFTFPGRPASRYQVVTFPFYDSDTPEKIAALSRELAASDYVVFQTKRIYGAVTRSEKKFPLTNDFFRAIFAGDLGYVLIKDFTSRPGLFGITLPDELADESFSVYDHPKALVFENRGRLSSGDIEIRIRRALPSRPVSRTGMLLAKPGASTGTARAEQRSVGIRSSILATFLLAAFVELLGLVAFAVLSRLIPPRPGLHALSKVIGVLGFAYVPWLVVSLGGAPFGRPLLLSVAALLLIAGWRARRKSPPVDITERRTTERVFWGTFLFFLLVRALSPEVYWGERPMDFAFLNTLYRTSTLPPPEPWCAGTPLSYTYFGHFVVAALGKALAIHPGVMFNLGIALFAALTAAAVLAAGTALNGRRTGLLAVFLVLFTANLSSIRELIARRTVNFDYFWATSRVIPNTINEYPFWSFVFGDLHAHVLVMPFSMGFVALLLLWLTRGQVAATTPGREAAGFFALGGLLFGAVQVTNGWSIPTYASLLLFLLLVVWLRGEKPPGLAGFVRSFFADVLSPAAGVVVLAAILYRPFWTRFTPPARHFGLEAGPWARPSNFLQIWGLFLLLLVPFFFLTWRRSLRGGAGAPSAPRKLAMAAVAVLLFVSLFRLTPPVGEALSVRAFTFSLFVLGLFLTLKRDTPSEARLPLALATFAFAVTAGCEVVFVWDRMNTLFKFYLEAWFLFAIAAAYVLDTFMTSAPEAPRTWRLWRAWVGVALAVCLFTSGTALVGYLTMNRPNGPRGTLDGTEYLKTFSRVDDLQRPIASPADSAAYEWLNRNVPGIPVLCEAYGPSYQEYSRVSMNTGLPIVIGWEYHVLQRGHSQAEIDRRKDDVRTIYTSPDKTAVRAALSRYRVALVYVGPLERSTYAGANLVRFGEWTDLMTPLYRNPDVTVFAVKDNFRAASPVTAIARVEELPEATKTGASPAAPPQDEPGKVKQPRGLALDEKGNVFVCDFGNNRIQKLDGKLAPLAAWGRRGSAPGEFKDPCGIALGPGDLVYVADTWNSRVQVFDAQGKYLREWSANFFGPRGVAVDRNGRVYVCDTGNGRVVRFDAGGNKELEFGKKGEGEGQLLEPNGLAVDKSGRVWVCDNGNGRVVAFDREGRFLVAFPVLGFKREVFSEPNIAVDAKGNLWVTVPAAHEVRAYTPEGRFLKAIKSSPDHVLDKPVGIAIARDGRLLVSDIENRLEWVGTTE